MKFRILMIGTSLNSHGGISILQKNLINNWPKCDYIVKHLTTHEDGTKFHKLQVFLKSLIYFVYLILCEKPHLIHLHFSINASIYRKSIFVIIAKIFGIKILLQSHTGEFEPYFNSLNRFAQYYLKFTLNLADGLIVLGTKDIEIYKKYYYKTEPIVLKNSISSQGSQSTLESQQIITVGSLGYRKGTYDLIKAIPLVTSEFPRAKFLLVGDGDVDIIKKIVEKENINKNVAVTGWVQSDKLPSLYLASSIFVLPSYYEGLPMAILEAMSYGLPVISTNINGIPDAVINGETGILIEPGQIEDLSKAILYLLSDSKLRKRMGQQGKHRVETLFSISGATQGLIRIYNNIILEKDVTKS